MRGDRLFVDAVIYRAKTGIPWRDLPERFGPWKSVYNRFSNWAKKDLVVVRGQLGSEHLGQHHHFETASRGRPIEPAYVFGPNVASLR